MRIGTRAPSPAPVHVVALIESGRAQDVFDLTIEGAHEFFANGILVHNSMDCRRDAIFSRFGLPVARRALPGHVHA